MLNCLSYTSKGEEDGENVTGMKERSHRPEEEQKTQFRKKTSTDADFCSITYSHKVLRRGHGTEGEENLGHVIKGKHQTTTDTC